MRTRFFTWVLVFLGIASGCSSTVFEGNTTKSEPASGDSTSAVDFKKPEAVAVSSETSDKKKITVKANAGTVGADEEFVKSQDSVPTTGTNLTDYQINVWQVNRNEFKKSTTDNLTSQLVGEVAIQNDGSFQATITLGSLDPVVFAISRRGQSSGQLSLPAKRSEASSSAVVWIPEASLPTRPISRDALPVEIDSYAKTYMDNSIVCGAAGSSCYQNERATAARFAVTPSGKKLVYVDADGPQAGTFFLWTEHNSNKVLRADGLDDWQKTLNPNGMGYSANHLTSIAGLAGRVCPKNVYIDDKNKFTSGSCLYYSIGQGPQSLDKDGTNGTDGLFVWDQNGGQPKWFVGNIKTCHTKGMRLPTLYETTAPSSANTPAADGTPTFSEGSGVPANNNAFTYTATASTSGMALYFVWNGSTVNTKTYGIFEAQANIVCVLPGGNTP